MHRRAPVNLALVGLTALAGLAAPNIAHAGIPVAVQLSEGDDEVEIVDGTMVVNGAQVLDFSTLAEVFDWDITIEGGEGNDLFWVDDIPKWVTITIEGGDDEDSIVNYDESQTITVDGGPGVDACAENVAASHCETEVDLLALGLRWDYDQANAELTLRGTSGDDQFAIFNVFTVGFYLFNGQATGLGDVLWDFGDGDGGNPVDSLVIHGHRGADEIWVMPGSHAEQVTVYGGRGADHITIMGTIDASTTVHVDAGGNDSDTCYRGENDLTTGTYTTTSCELSGYRDWSDFTLPE